MIRIQITSPFTYEYFNGDAKLLKRHYLTAGNYYHLDEEKDKEEIRFILSPNFIFKNYIYVNLETVSQDLQNELNLENGFYEDTSVPDDEYIPTLLQNNRFIDASESYIHDDLNSDPSLTVEPTPNIFDQTFQNVDEVNVEVKLKETEVLGAENTPDLIPLEQFSEEVEEVKSYFNEEKNARKSVLDDLHYSKVKEIAELYKIEYTSKKAAIDLILTLEFIDD